MISRLLRRIHHDFRYELTTGQRSALVGYLSYSVSILLVRALTTAIKGQRLRVHNINLRGVHVHHYLPGIALLTTSGAFGVRGSDRPSVHCMLGATYGVGCALVTDELPLLLNLRDVYWAREGRWAIDLALIIVAGFGAYFSGIPLWRGIRDEATTYSSRKAAMVRRDKPSAQRSDGNSSQTPSQSTG
jgi:hypothetical protein